MQRNRTEAIVCVATSVFKDIAFAKSKEKNEWWASLSTVIKYLLPEIETDSTEFLRKFGLKKIKESCKMIPIQGSSKGQSGLGLSGEVLNTVLLAAESLDLYYDTGKREINMPEMKRRAAALRRELINSARNALLETVTDTLDRTSQPVKDRSQKDEMKIKRSKPGKKQVRKQTTPLSMTEYKSQPSSTAPLDLPFEMYNGIDGQNQPVYAFSSFIKSVCPAWNLSILRYMDHPNAEQIEARPFIHFKKNDSLDIPITLAEALSIVKYVLKTRGKNKAGLIANANKVLLHITPTPSSTSIQHPSALQSSEVKQTPHVKIEAPTHHPDTSQSLSVESSSSRHSFHRDDDTASQGTDQFKVPSSSSENDDMAMDLSSEEHHPVSNTQDSSSDIDGFARTQTQFTSPVTAFPSSVIFAETTPDLSNTDDSTETAAEWFERTKAGNTNTLTSSSTSDLLQHTMFSGMLDRPRVKKRKAGTTFSEDTETFAEDTEENSQPPNSPKRLKND